MTDIEGILDDMSYLIALEESKRISDATDRKSTLILPSYFVLSYVSWWMMKNSVDTFDHVFEDEIEMYFFKCFVDGNDDASKKWNELEKIREIDQNISLKKSSKYSLTDEIIKKYNWNEIDPQISSYTDETDYDSIKGFIQERQASLFEYFELVFIDFVRGRKFNEYTRWKYLEITLDPKINDFYTHRLLGMGGFGVVCAVNHIPTGKIYAMKKMSKRILKVNHSENIATNERIMMTNVESDFIVNLAYAFQDSKNLYLIMDLMDGGDLAFHIRQKGSLSLLETIFYSGQIILGLEYLHNRSIAYLDLKPNNILLDSYGHSRISDLGLACYDYMDIKSRRGTIGYMAPEVIYGKKFDHVADFFSLGCTIIKMIVGKNLMNSKDKGSKYHQIEPKFDEFVKVLPPSCYNIVVRLLEKDPCLRLGAPPHGIDEIKSHEMYTDLNWRSLYHKIIPPPILPAKNQINTDYPSSVNSSTSKNLPKLSDEDQKIYKEFNYVHGKLWRKEVMETVFKYINNKNDQKQNKKIKSIQDLIDVIKNDEDIICFGEIFEYSSLSLRSWKLRCMVLFKNKIELLKDYIPDPKTIKLTDVGEIKFESLKIFKCIRLTCNNQRRIFRGVTSDETQWWFDNLTEIWLKKEKYSGTLYVQTSLKSKFCSEQNIVSNFSDPNESTTIWET